MRKNESLRALLITTLIVFGTSAVHAGYKWEGFDGGNAPGFTKLGDYTWNEKNMLTDWKQWRALGQSWGGIYMSSKITQPGVRGEGGGYWMNSGGWKSAAFESRTSLWGNSEGNKYVWAGWWVYNNRQTWDNYYEIDMMETGHTGNFNNYYYHWDTSKNTVVGTFYTNPNSFGWRTAWHNYKCWVQNGDTVHFYLDGQWKVAHEGANRSAEYAQPKYQSHAWPPSAIADNAPVQNLPYMFVDWYQVWF